MGAKYISVERNNVNFEYYKKLWGSRGIEGIRVDTMTECIELACAIEKSKAETLYFIDIVAGEINFMPQLAILEAESNAPIIIATSHYDEDEHQEALNNGAYFYGSYSENPEKNISVVMAAVNSYHRAKKQKSSTAILTYGGGLVSLLQRRVFVNDVSIDLTRQEFDILCYLMKNRGNVLTYRQIYRRVWGGEYEDSEREILRNAIKRLREKLKIGPKGIEYIETARDVGYFFTLTIDK